jgi:hypothetical protein|tara:strand:+ start:391 stop:534 length:144 start_codon:yes stop_codon:yes gene_type:complete
MKIKIEVELDTKTDADELEELIEGLSALRSKFIQDIQNGDEDDEYDY